MPKEPPRMLNAFDDPAVPDGAESMGDDWKDGGGTSSSAQGGGGGSSDGFGGPIEVPAPPQTTYRAICFTCRDNGDSWEWPERPTYEAAAAEAVQHLADFPDHDALVG